MSSTNKRASSRAVFAERFALLYAEAGEPALKQVVESVARARRSDGAGRPVRVTVQRVSDWRRGRNVPARFPGLEAVLTVLVGQARKRRTRPVMTGLYDLSAWRRLWEQALAAPVTGSDEVASVEDGVCPYLGLAAYGAEQAGWFFGRDRAVADLVALLSLCSETGGGPVLVVGASGAGKSSLLRAGLVPALASGMLPGAADWPVRCTTPGSDPIQALATEVPGLAQALAAEESRFEAGVRAAFGGLAGPADKCVLVVDQFEEVFTLCEQEERRRKFIQLLQTACTGPDASAIVVLGLRADFYDRCLEYSDLVDASQHRQLVLGSMRVAEVREAVTGPARAVGLKLETGLEELLLRDLGLGDDQAGTHSYDPGALPLLSHALLVTWQRRAGGRLTVAGYRAAGGISGSVAVTAELAWSGLDADGQVAARDLLMRLVRVGEEGQDTRRAVRRAELLDAVPDPEVVEEVIETLARARLVTLDGGTVQVTHEALLRVWPRLRGWLDEGRSDALMRQRLEDDAVAWAKAGQDASLLYRGGRLDAALAAMGTGQLMPKSYDRTGSWRDRMVSRVRQVVSTARGRVALRSTSEPSVEASVPNGAAGLAGEYLAAALRAQRRGALFLRAVAVGIVTFALVAGVSAVVAVEQRDAVAAGRLTAEADRLANVDQSLAAELSAVAYRLNPDDNGAYTRLLATQQSVLNASFPAPAPEITATTYNSRRRLLATVGRDFSVRLWDTRRWSAPKELGRFALPSQLQTEITAPMVLQISPSGRLLFVGAGASSQLWDISRTHQVRPLWIRQEQCCLPVTSVSFTPDDGLLAVGAGTDSFGSSDTAGAASLRGTRAVQLIALDLNGQQAEPIQTLSFQAAAGPRVRFSPGGSYFAVTSDRPGQYSWLWKVERTPVFVLRATSFPGFSQYPDLPRKAGNAARPLDFAADDSALLYSYPSGGVTLVRAVNADRTAPAQLHSFNLSISGDIVLFGPEGKSLIELSKTKIRIWDVGNGEPHITLDATAFQPGTSPTWFVGPEPGSLFAFDQDGRRYCWNLPSNLLLGSIANRLPVVMDSVSSLLVQAEAGGRVTLFDISSPGSPVRRGGFQSSLAGEIRSLALRPDGAVLAVEAADHLTLWDLHDLARPREFGSPVKITDGANTYTLAFDPAGTTLITGMGPIGLGVWDVADPRRPHQVYPELPSARGALGAAVGSTSIDPVADIIALVYREEAVHLWSIRDPRKPVLLSRLPIPEPEGLAAVVLDPENQLLATTVYGGDVQLWDIRNPGDPVKRGSVPSSVGTRLAFWPERKLLVAENDQRQFQFWDVSDPDGPVAFGKPFQLAGALNSLSLDGSHGRMATRSSNGSTIVWDMDAENVIQRICRRTHGALTPEKWAQHIPGLSYGPPCGATV